MQEIFRLASCPYCYESNEVMWPADGNYFARAIPEHMESRPDMKAILDAQEKGETARGATQGLNKK
jgi:hypothetical protein